MNNEKTKNVDTLLAALDAQAKGDFESYEDFQENYSEGQQREMYENLISLNPSRAAALMARRNSNGSNPINGLSGRYANLQATMNLTAVRESANIPQNLPVPFFGTAFQNSAFLNINLPLPPGVVINDISFGRTNFIQATPHTYAVVGGGGGTVPVDPLLMFVAVQLQGLEYQNRMVISYKQTSNGAIDAIEISSTTTAYPDILAALATDAFHVYKSRMTISDPTQQQQFQTQLSFLRKSLFSNANSDTLDLSTFLAPTDFKTNVIDIDAKYDVDKEFVFCPSIIAIAGFQITFSLFIDKYSRHTAKGLFTR